MWLLRLILVLASNDIARWDFRETIIFSLVGNQAGVLRNGYRGGREISRSRNVPFLSNLHSSRDEIVKRVKEVLFYSYAAQDRRVWIKQVHVNNIFCKLTQYVTRSLYLSLITQQSQQTLTLKIRNAGTPNISYERTHSHGFVTIIDAMPCIPRTFSDDLESTKPGGLIVLSRRSRSSIYNDTIFPLIKSTNVLSTRSDREHLVINIKAAIYGGSLVAGPNTCRQSSRRRASVAKCIWTIAKFKNKSKFEGIARSSAARLVRWSFGNGSNVQSIYETPRRRGYPLSHGLWYPRRIFQELTRDSQTVSFFKQRSFLPLWIYRWKCRSAQSSSRMIHKMDFRLVGFIPRGRRHRSWSQDLSRANFDDGGPRIYGVDAIISRTCSPKRNRKLNLERTIHIFVSSFVSATVGSLLSPRAMRRSSMRDRSRFL